MSSQDTDTDTESAGESIDAERLKKRVEDLEVEIYGYNRSTGLSAGDTVVVTLKQTVVFLEKQHRRQTGEDERYAGVPVEEIYGVVAVLGIERDLAEQAFEKLRRQGEVYEPVSGMVRAT